jgi:hypothetical protein
MEPNLNRLSDDTPNVPGFGGGDTVVLELDAVSRISDGLDTEME